MEHFVGSSKKAYFTFFIVGTPGALSLIMSRENYNKQMNSFGERFGLNQKQWDVDALPQRLRWKIGGCCLAFGLASAAGLWNIYAEKKQLKVVDAAVVCVTTLDICSTLNSFAVAKYLGYRQDYVASLFHSLPAIWGLSILWNDYRHS